ncbi:MAG: hypothetical protein ACKVW3_02960 [Phycisphaerales bacterium]
MFDLGPLEEQIALLSASVSIGGAVAIAAMILGRTGVIRVPRIGWRPRAAICGGALGVGVAAVAAKVLVPSVAGVIPDFGLAFGALGMVFLPVVVESALRASANRRSMQALALVSRRLERREADEAAIARVSAAITDAARAA